MMAFVFALVSVGVTSRLAFDHQLPDHPEEVVTYLATLGATVIVGWWLANVFAWAAALRRGIPIDRYTLPGTKRIAQLFLAVALSTSCVADPTDDPVMVLVEQRGDLAPASTDAAPTTAPPSTAPPTTAPPSTAPPTTAPPSTAPPSTAPPDGADEPAPAPPSEPTPTIQQHEVVVRTGDNLWSLTAETLTEHGSDAPSCEQIAEYWRLVVAANRVRSGNPDLIVAGETVTMPAFDLATGGLTAPGDAGGPPAGSATSGITPRR